MKIKDLTNEQLLEILHLIYPYKDTISDVKFYYQPTDGDDGNYQMIIFTGMIFENKTDIIRVYIHSNLDCEIDFIRNDEPQGRLPVRNQKLIQQKFTEFGF